MNSYGKLWIIPNEEEIIQEVYERNIEAREIYPYYLQEFSQLYNLGFDFTEPEYQNAPCEIAQLGHVVVKTDNEVSLVLCYIPEKVTDRQCNWFYKNGDMLNKYQQVKCYSLQTTNGNNVCWEKINGIYEIMREVNKKNLLKEKGMRK